MWFSIQASFRWDALFFFFKSFSWTRNNLLAGPSKFFLGRTASINTSSSSPCKCLPAGSSAPRLLLSVWTSLLQKEGRSCVHNSALTRESSSPATCQKHGKVTQKQPFPGRYLQCTLKVDFFFLSSWQLLAKEAREGRVPPNDPGVMFSETLQFSWRSPI